MARSDRASASPAAERTARPTSMRLRYMLDTDTVSFALRGVGEVGDHLLRQPPSSVCMSAITVAELRYGAERRRSRKLHRLIDDFASSVLTLSFDDAAASRFGEIASELAARGSQIG